MVTINRGQVVGVSYRAESGVSCRGAYCVHNGRLVGGILSITANTIRVSTRVNTDTLKKYRGIILSHLAVNQSGVVTQQFLYFSRAQMRRMRVTPYVQYGLSNCQRANRYDIPNIIFPGEGVGIRYFDTATGRWNVGNGRYLYWHGQTNHCNLDERPGSTNLQYLRRVYYSHFVLVDNQGNIGSGLANLGPANGQTNIRVYKLQIPRNGDSIRLRRSFRRVYTPRSAAFFRTRTIIYVQGS